MLRCAKGDRGAQYAKLNCYSGNLYLIYVKQGGGNAVYISDKVVFGCRDTLGTYGTRGMAFGNRVHKILRGKEHITVLDVHFGYQYLISNCVSHNSCYINSLVNIIDLYNYPKLLLTRF